MDDRSRTVGIIFLGLLALGSMGLMALLSLREQAIPASVGAAFGVAVGALAGLLSPSDRR